MKRSREPEEPPLPSSSSPPSSISSVDDTSSRATPAPSVPYNADGDRGETEQPRTKIVSLSRDLDTVNSEAEPATMTCLLHREQMDFPTYDSYESHYNKEHLNRCIECRRNFPSQLYLSLHSDECHDPFVAVKRDKGEHTYACFVQGCERKCASVDKRRRHLIDKHSFPKNFFFSITQFGIDGRQSLLIDEGGRRGHNRRRSSTSNVAKKDVRRRTASITMSGDTSATAESSQPVELCSGGKKTSSQVASDDNKAPAQRIQKNITNDSAKEVPDLEMDDLAGAMSAMKFVPRSVRFGRGGKSGFAR